MDFSLSESSLAVQPGKRSIATTRMAPTDLKALTITSERMRVRP